MSAQPAPAGSGIRVRIEPVSERADLPADPDRDHVPPELRENHGKVVLVTDAETGEAVEGVLHVEPGLFGYAARAAEDDA